MKPLNLITVHKKDGIQALALKRFTLSMINFDVFINLVYIKINICAIVSIDLHFDIQRVKHLMRSLIGIDLIFLYLSHATDALSY